VVEISRLGIALPLTARSPSSAHLLAELIDEVIAAETCGFGLCLIPEHRQGPEIGTGAPLSLAAALAARTHRIQLATGVLIATPHHPLHLAEQVAAIDNLSSGRFALGVGMGYQAADLAPFGVTFKSRARQFEHVVRSVRAFLDDQPAPNELADAEAIVRPLPTRRVPIWFGAWSSRGVERAAELGDGWIADPIRSVTEVAEMAERYRAACRARGRDGTVIVMRETWVGADDQSAIEEFGPVIEPIYRYYRRNGAFTDGAADGSEVAVAQLAEDRLVVGSAATCLARIDDIIDATGADHVVLHLRHPGGPTHEMTVRSIQALAAEL
jgi:alkanesulfonate monooxygenase SsuD/methylene tetrahydromethanopterin reductase-like flavin-dependent oxidoreductase (luciferase family)